MTQTSCGSSLSITSSFSCSSRTAEASTLRPSGSDDSFALIGTAGASHSGEERSRRRRELQEMRESSPVCARAPDGAGKAEGETAKGQDLGAEKVLARRSPSLKFRGLPWNASSPPSPPPPPPHASLGGCLCFRPPASSRPFVAPCPCLSVRKEVGLRHEGILGRNVSRYISCRLGLGHNFDADLCVRT